MTTLGPNVTLVEHSIVPSETLEDYIIQVDYALPLTYRAAQVPQLGDSYPGDTAPWGYIVINHESFKMVERAGGALRERFDLKLIDTRGVALGPYVTRVTYAKPKVPYDSGIENVKEVARKKRTGRRGRRMGIRVFLVPDVMADALAESHFPELKPMAAEGPWLYALLREKEIERRWRVGIARIEAMYDTQAQLGEILAVGKGILEADASAVRMWNNFKVDDAGHKVGVPYLDGGALTRWAVIKGMNAWPLVSAVLRIRVVLTNSQLSLLGPLVGKINSGACPKIIGAAKNTLWFEKLGLRQRKYGQSNLYDCLVYLNYHIEGWDTATTIEQQTHKMVEEAVFENDGVTDTGRKKDVWSWVSVASTQKDIPLDAEASFDVINGYL